ncbi:MAG: hypothetical protein GC162_11090 [Planctomycetes bacterium]|nr:hypothetical protein [Planctomycetota bacterium]
MDPINEQFEADLKLALAVAPPAGLARRVYDTTVNDLTACGVSQHELRRAHHVPTPAGLPQRVYDATVEPAHRDQPVVVIARIGYFAQAIAAAVLIAAGLGVYMLAQHAVVKQPDKSSLAWIQRELAQLDHSLGHTGNPIDAQILAISTDVDQAALSLADESEGSSTDSAEMLSDDLSVLEAQIQSF